MCVSSYLVVIVLLTINQLTELIYLIISEDMNISKNRLIFVRGPTFQQEDYYQEARANEYIAESFLSDADHYKETGAILNKIY